MKKLLFLVWLVGGAQMVLAQQATLQGTISNAEGQTLSGANIRVSNRLGTSSDQQGQFRLLLPANQSHQVTFSFVGYFSITRSITLKPGENFVVDIVLTPQSQVLPGLQIQDRSFTPTSLPGVTRINPRSARLLPTAFGEFNKVLATLPGVVSNNELSSTYAVRGGNFDENLVYVNDIPIYRPFLIRAGQQEGLSFVNPDLIDEIEFSAGGWAPRFGDKLSSVLDIKYKNPQQPAASVSVGLLGGKAHLEGSALDQRLNYLVGLRHKSAQYLLNTLETEGEYLPRFTDLQTYLNYNLDPEQNRTSLSLLVGFANNRYLVEPNTRETRFGTFTQSFRFLVGFDGQEILRYRTLQGGIQLKHQFNDRWQTQIIASGLLTQEREYFDVEGAYRLCDVDNNPGSAGFNECTIVRGIGSNYRSGRNKLDARIFNFINHTTFKINPQNRLEFGIQVGKEDIEDELNEFEFTDSADFVNINQPPINSSVDLDSYRFEGYIQHTREWGNQRLTYGVRLNYWTINEQFLISPRAQYSLQTNWARPLTLNLAAGYYRQQPFYRELRNFSGAVNLNVRAQSSLHLIAGTDYNFKLWDRDFKFVSELYYKSIDDVIPYDIDNVRIRYYGDNLGTAYATGLDLRVNGAFIEGTDSWFSLGLLRTEEEIDNDGLGRIRRPSDQTVNLGIYFEDYLPNDPSVRVYLNVLFGSGLPFGPPNRPDFRNQFNGRAYNRMDIGFAKLISFTPANQNKLGLKSIWLNAEVLNLLGARNTISYTWITDLQNRQFGVPNNLSQRYFNFKIWAEF